MRAKSRPDRSRFVQPRLPPRARFPPLGAQPAPARAHNPANQIEPSPVVLAMVLSGSLGYVLVPVLAERRAAGSEREAAAVAAQIGFYLVAISLALFGISVVMARELTKLLCPGFSTDEQELTASLLRVSAALIVANSLIAYLN